MLGNKLINKLKRNVQKRAVVLCAIFLRTQWRICDSNVKRLDFGSTMETIENEFKADLTSYRLMEF